MKNLYIAAGVMALMVSATSCKDEYDLYPEEYGEVMMIKDSGRRNVTVYKTDDFTMLPVTVMKGGTSPENPSKVSLHTMDETEWADYVELTNNKALMRIDPECYTFEYGSDVQSVDCDFAGSGVRYSIKNFYMIPSKLIAWEEKYAADIANGFIPVIPMQIDLDGDGAIQKDNKYLLLTPDLQMAKVDFNVSGPQAKVFARNAIQNNLDGAGEGFYPDVNIQLPCTNKWGFTVNMYHRAGTDMTKYCEENNITDWVMMPRQLYEVVGLDVEGSGITTNPAGRNGEQYLYHLKPGQTSMPLNIKIKTDYLKTLFADGDYSNMNVNYVIPIKLLGNLEFDPQESGVELPVGLEPNRSNLVFVVFSVQELLELLQIDGSSCDSNDCEPSEGSVANLFDDNIETFFHSTWSDGGSSCTAPFYSYIQMPLDEEFSSVFFEVGTRKGGALGGTPSEIHLYGSNVEDPQNEQDWFKFAEIKNAHKILTAAGQMYSLGSQSKPYTSIDENGAHKRFKHLRFCVVKSKDGSLTETSKFWYLSEIKVYAGQVIE